MVLALLSSFTCPYLLQVFVTVDELSLMRVLEFMGLDILPQGLDDDRSGLGVDAQHTGQSGVQLELRWLGSSTADMPLDQGVPFTEASPLNQLMFKDHF